MGDEPKGGRPEPTSEAPGRRRPRMPPVEPTLPPSPGQRMPEVKPSLPPSPRPGIDLSRATSFRRRQLSPDIEILPPEAGFSLSRGDQERKLRRVDRYDRRAEVTAYETLTSTGTVRISFRVLDDEPFEFVPGHFVGIRAEVPGKGMRRTPYCIITKPNEEKTFQLLIRMVPDGPLSMYLASLRRGHTIEFRGPSGRSMLPREGDEELVLLATGVGVGPFLALVDHLADEGFERPIQLYWGLRLVEDICLLDELEALRRRLPTFRYDITLSQPPASWTGLRGRITESVPPLITRLNGVHFLMVGNGAMIEEMFSALSDQGVDEQFLYREPYFNVRHRPDPKVMAEIRNRFVALDLFSPWAHQQQGGYMPERPAFPKELWAKRERGE